MTMTGVLAVSGLRMQKLVISHWMDAYGQYIVVGGSIKNIEHARSNAILAYYMQRLFFLSGWVHNKGCSGEMSKS